MAYIKVVERGQPHKYKDESTYCDLVAYCCDPAKAIYTGTVNLQSIATAATEMQMTAQTHKKNFGKRVSHIIISFSDAECPSISSVEQIARNCAQYFANKYQVFYSIHVYPNIHIHMIVNRVSFVDGKKYPDRYEDWQSFWYYAHGVLMDYGIRLWK